MSTKATDSKPTAPSRGLFGRLAMVFPLVLLVILAANPFPSHLNSLDARVEYTRQVILHVLGINPTYDVEALNKAYARQADAARRIATASLGGQRKRPFQLNKLPEVDAVNNPNWYEEFSRVYLQEENPIVVRGLMYARTDIFPGAKEWNIEYLKTKVYKNTKVPVFTNTTNDKSAVLEPFSDFVEGLKDKSKTRYARCLDDNNHTMRKGFSIQKLASLMDKSIQNEMTFYMNGDYGNCLFVGASHVNTRMHCDVGTSAFMMIQGRKRWTMFPASESMYFLPVGHLFNVAYNSLVDVFAEDILEKFPFASLAKGWEVVIEAGDVLFFPAFTWHAVENLDDLTVGMDFAVYDTVGSMRRNPILASGTIFNLRIWYRVLEGLLQGKIGSMKATFFEGYLKDDVKAKSDSGEQVGQYF